MDDGDAVEGDVAMSGEKINPMSLSVAELVSVIRRGGHRGMTEEAFSNDVSDGFMTNADGTVDVFDYLTWLVGRRLSDPPPRVPPTKGFDMASVSPVTLAGWLTMYNHLGYDVPKSRLTGIISTYRDSVCAKDDESHFDFSRLLAFSVTHGRIRAKSVSAKGYEAHKAEMARRNREASAAGRDIGDIPEVSDPERRESCRMDFRLFCETYFHDSFSLKWSDDHLKCISKIEQCVLVGGLFALAMPRGSGKSSLSEAAAVWAMLYGHREFVCLVGATETAALEMLESIRTEIESNELLDADFPEVCYPISKLEGIVSRANGQTVHGERTRITWTANEIVLPTVKESVSSGIIVRCAGITGRIRGMRYKRSDGRSVRPDLVIVDDPQTRDSARSLSQNRTRERILSGDILGLAGPGRKIAGIMPCTVIERGDMADVILDRDKHPEWNGERCKMLYAMPSHMELWEEYFSVMDESLRELGNISRATEFYRENRDRMDEGAVVAWPERHNDDEESALQNAMNLMHRDHFAFSSEYQNEPMSDDEDMDRMLSADEIASKTNGLDRMVVPLDCHRLTMFVDVQKTCLFYTVCAFSDDFTGAVIEYGTFPEQNTRRFSLSTITRRLCDIYKSSVEAQLYSGISALVKDKASCVYSREDGTELQIGLIAIDANWGISTDIVYQFCRQTEFRGRVIPAHGRYVGASSKPMSEYRKKPGERVGLNWIVTSSASQRAIRHIAFDTNFWKSFVHERLASPIGDRGCLTLYGSRPYEHELYAEHMTAEFRVRTQGRGRTVDEWKLRPDRSDNHWLDCTVGCAVLASSMGCALPENRQDNARRVISLRKIEDGKSPSSQPKDAPKPPVGAARRRISLAAIRREAGRS